MRWRRRARADAETIARWSESWVGRQGWLPAEETTSAAAAPGDAAEARPATRH